VLISLGGGGIEEKEESCRVLMVNPVPPAITGKRALDRHSSEGRKPGKGRRKGIRSLPNILAGKRNGTLCAGVTSDLRTRVREHKNNLVEGFRKGTLSIYWSGTSFMRPWNLQKLGRSG